MMSATMDPSTQTLTEQAHAKINLYLHVTGKRPDGYHLLDSLVVFAGAGDSLQYEPGPEPLHLELTGRFGKTLGADAAGPDNLVMKAAAALRAVSGSSAHVQGGRLVLAKELPVASGIGGGSADAAAALRLLARAWQVDVPVGTHAYGGKTGRGCAGLCSQSGSPHGRHRGTSFPRALPAGVRHGARELWAGRLHARCLSETRWCVP